MLFDGIVSFCQASSKRRARRRCMLSFVVQHCFYCDWHRVVLGHFYFGNALATCIFVPDLSK